jgi:hypothetical protein
MSDTEKLSIEFDVRGSEPIKFSEGWMTGDMEESGVEICTVWYQDGKRYGGCINREEAEQLRDFLNKCIDVWGRP